MPRKTMKCTNKEMGEHLVRHINMVYQGSVPSYCTANNINYSGLCKALNGSRGFSQEQVAPLLWDKKTDTYFERDLGESNASREQEVEHTEANGENKGIPGRSGLQKTHLW